MIHFISTRGGGQPQTFEQVLLTGLAPDGGLYVPESWPQLDLAALKGRSYTEIAEAVMYPYVEGSIPREDFREILKNTYGPEFFRHKDVVPLHKIKDNLYALELFHGPTIAFKDVALQLLGRLFDYVLKKRGEHITIVGATSGDTGSAAIEGCKVSEQLDVFILFPNGRVSEVQRRQMTTVEGDNIHNIALEGTFDDCQNAVKDMFADEDFRAKVNLSAVNSINWARIMAQIVYYVTSALELGAPDKDVSFVVPTGNFGNAFAAFCARQMGLPIKTLAISTNKNDILTRFFETGEMRMGDVHPSISPSMDIQISSNFERYLFELLGRDGAQVREIMQDFKTNGFFALDDDLMATSRNEFRAFRADDARTVELMSECYNETGYSLDPHTAVGYAGAKQLAQDPYNGAVVSLACAHPAKFPDAVTKAIDVHPELPQHLSDLHERTERMDVLPNDLEGLKSYVLKHASLTKEKAA